jgi:AcrR family transcriptional regulator
MGSSTGAAGEPAARKPLTRTRVLDAALRLADAEGGDALSMRKVSELLAVKPMALYNHVANKDDLLLALRDLVVDEIALPAETGDWQASMRACALSAHHALRRHPWAGPIWVRPTPTRTLFRYMEARLACLRVAGFDVEAAYVAHHVLENYVVGYTNQQGSFATTFPTWDEGGMVQVTSRALPMLPVDEFPFLVEHIRLHLENPGHGHRDDFEFGLDLILDGLERHRATG